MTTTGNGPAQSTKRRTAFRVISTLWAASGIAFGVFTALFAVLDEGQEIHAIHNAVVTALLLVLSAPAAVAAARAPERSTRPLVHLSAVGIAGLITMALSLTLDPFTLPLVILVGVLWALRPSREEPIASVSPSPILLVFVAAAAGPLVAYALGQAELQRIDDVSEHAEFFHWVETSFYAVAILLLGLLAALRPAAHRFSGCARYRVGLGSDRGKPRVPGCDRMGIEKADAPCSRVGSRNDASAPRRHPTSRSGARCSLARIRVDGSNS